MARAKHDAGPSDDDDDDDDARIADLLAEQKALDPRAAFRQRLVAVVAQRMNETHTSAAELAELLGLSKRITYRRLAGQTEFSDYEFALLCRHLSIPSTAVWEADVPPLTFAAPIAADAPFSKLDYLARVRRAALEGESADSVVGGALASDYLPHFYLHRHPPLALLTLYLFELPLKRTQVGPLRLAEYGELHADWIAGTDAHSRGWHLVDTAEVWGHNPLDYVLSKLVSLRTSGLLPERADVATLFDTLEVLVESLEASLSTGTKPDGPGELLVSRDWSSTVRNMLLIEGRRMRTLFLTFGSATFLSTRQPEAYDYFERYFQSMRRFSEPVTGRAAAVATLVGDMRQALRKARKQVEAIED